MISRDVLVYIGSYLPFEDFYLRERSNRYLVQQEAINRFHQGTDIEVVDVLLTYEDWQLLNVLVEMFGFEILLDRNPIQLAKYILQGYNAPKELVGYVLDDLVGVGERSLFDKLYALYPQPEVLYSSIFSKLLEQSIEPESLFPETEKLLDIFGSNIMNFIWK